ncbi:MAG TPA: ArsA-related P-loop ATPase, partial [Baekduia sp.]|nr:ArsA-related P-loop ATPase [Baekduia sp.]
VWDLTQRPRRDRRRRRARADVVILDAPSTGHAVALLGAPGTFAAVGSTGPVATQAQAIDAFLHDRRRTAVVAVATAEELAVAETLLLRDALRTALRLEVDRVVVDGLLPDRFSPAELRAVDALRPSPARRAVRSAATRAAQQRRELEHLRAGLPGVPVATLPFVFAPALGPRDLERLSRVLDR